MKIENLIQIILFSFFGIAACNSNPQSETAPQKIRISLSADSTAVELHQVPEHILEYFQSDSLGQKEWQSFFSVYPDAPDTEFRDLQSALDGKYLVNDSLILFIPKEKFKKDSAYFARFYAHSLLTKPSDVISGQSLFGEAEFVEFDFKR